MSDMEFVFDINDIKNKTLEFETKFNALTTLTPGNKIGINLDDNLYAEYITQPYIMAIIRKITGQKRIDINCYLLAKFEDYENLLLYLINAFEYYSCSGNHDTYINFDAIFLSHKILCLGLVSGLANLKLVYHDYPPILDTCDKYSVKFNLFRGKNINITLPFNNSQT